MAKKTPLGDLLKYDTSEGVKLFVGFYLANGCSIARMAKTLGYARETLYRWVREYSELSLALRKVRKDMVVSKLNAELALINTTV